MLTLITGSLLRFRPLQSILETEGHGDKRRADNVVDVITNLLLLCIWNVSRTEVSLIMRQSKSWVMFNTVVSHTDKRATIKQGHFQWSLTLAGDHYYTLNYADLQRRANSELCTITALLPGSGLWCTSKGERGRWALIPAILGRTCPPSLEIQSRQEVLVVFYCVWGVGSEHNGTASQCSQRVQSTSKGEKYKINK